MESGVKAKACTNHKDRLAEEDHGEAERENKYKGIMAKGIGDTLMTLPTNQTTFIHSLPIHPIGIYEVLIMCLTFCQVLRMHRKIIRPSPRKCSQSPFYRRQNYRYQNITRALFKCLFKFYLNEVLI